MSNRYQAPMGFDEPPLELSPGPKQQEFSVEHLASSHRIWPFITELQFPVELRMPRRTSIMQMFERDNTAVVRLGIPGMEPGDIQVFVDGSVLSIKAARGGVRNAEIVAARRGELVETEFSGVVLLPDTVEQRSARATYSDGVLEVSILKPKSPAGTFAVPIAREPTDSSCCYGG